MLLLPHDTTHIWLADTRTLEDTALHDTWRNWLSDTEQARINAHQRPQAQLGDLMARAMVRWCLSQYSDSTAPQDWQIERTPHGKPHLVDSHLPLHFSLSHSGDWLALAILADTEVGLDIEQTSRRNDWQAIAKRYFSAEEVAELDALEPSQQKERFYTLWTLKEAFFKASGTGISAGLNKASFQLDNNGRIQAQLDQALKQSARDWQFHHYHLGQDYCLSLALERPSAQDASARFYKTIPGQDMTQLNLEAGHIILQ